LGIPEFLASAELESSLLGPQNSQLIYHHAIKLLTYPQNRDSVILK